MSTWKWNRTGWQLDLGEGVVVSAESTGAHWAGHVSVPLGCMNGEATAKSAQLATLASLLQRARTGRIALKPAVVQRLQAAVDELSRDCDMTDAELARRAEQARNRGDAA